MLWRRHNERSRGVVRPGWHLQGGRKNLPKVFGKYGQKFQASKRKKRSSKIFRNYMQKNLDLWHEVSGKFKIHPGQQTPQLQLCHCIPVISGIARAQGVCCPGWTLDLLLPVCFFCLFPHKFLATFFWKFQIFPTAYGFLHSLSNFPPKKIFFPASKIFPSSVLSSIK